MKKAKELRNRIKEYYKNKDLNTSVETIEVDMVRHFLTEHDQEIKNMIDEMIEKERSLSEGDMTYDATDLLTEIRSKL